MSEVIKDKKMREFVYSNIGNDFSLSIDEVAEKCKSYGRFSAWLNSDVTRIKEVLNKVKSVGVSPAFFASYERTEGYNSSWGWLNHTKVNGNPVQDAESVANWIVSQSKNTTDKPAWIDYANYKDFVPADIKQAGNEDFANMKSGSIGKVIIAGTAAATWEVYYPLGLKKEYNGVQDYGAPINNMIVTIEAWGGKIDSDSNGGGSNGDGQAIINQVITILNNGENDLKNAGKVDTSGVKDEILTELRKMFKPPVNKVEGQMYFNSYFKVTQVFTNLLKINGTEKLYTKLEKIIDEAMKNIKVTFDVSTVFNRMRDEVRAIDTGGNGGGGSGKFYFPVDYTQTGVNFWHPPYASGSVQEQMEYGYDRGTHVHIGYDIGAGGNTGLKVFAVKDGEVTHVGQDGQRGQNIRIKHSTDEYHSLYQHLVVGSQQVKVGDKVKAGQHIATMGNSPGGYSIHLHIEISKNGTFDQTNTINPRPYLKVTGDNKTDLPNPK